MRHHQLFAEVQEYDGTLTQEIIDLYADLWDARFDLRSDDPDVVTESAERTWIATCIAFKWFLNGDEEGAGKGLEIPRERPDFAYRLSNQSRLKAVTAVDMEEEVYNYLCDEYRHYIEEWAAIRHRGVEE